MREAIASAPGKINLALRVGELGADGYHPLWTVFEAVSLLDYVHVRTRRAPGISVETVGYRPSAQQLGQAQYSASLTADLGALDMPGADAEHLAVRAARALQPLAAGNWGSSSAGVAITVHKTIPVAGGMAGGSADAAATLVALNDMWGLGLSAQQLLAVGATLGADVPACLLGGLSLGQGRGDQLQPLDTAAGDPLGTPLGGQSGESAAPTQFWALLFPPGGLSTPEVFSQFDALGMGRSQLPGGDLQPPLGEAPDAPGTWSPDNALSNDLAAAALALRPELAALGAKAREAGALDWVVSGSGPTVAALCANADQAAEVAAACTATDPALRTAIACGPVAGAQLQGELPSWCR